MAFSMNKQLAKRPSSLSPELLKAADIAEEIVIKILGVQEPPRRYSAVAMFAIEGAPNNRTMWAANLTACKKLAEYVGDDLEVLVGKHVALYTDKVLLNGEPVLGIIVRAVVSEADATLAEQRKAAKKRRG